MAFDVALRMSLSEQEIRSQSVPWLITRYEWLEEAEWGHLSEEIMAVEVGTMRALSQAFGEKKLPDLPTYDELVDRQQMRREVPAWWLEYQKANPGVKI